MRIIFIKLFFITYKMSIERIINAIESYYYISKIITDKYDEWKNITKNNYNNDEIMDEHIKRIESYQNVIDKIYDVLENANILNKYSVLEELGELYIMCDDVLEND